MSSSCKFTLQDVLPNVLISDVNVVNILFVRSVPNMDIKIREHALLCSTVVTRICSVSPSELG